jgi:hypothetical protein
MRKVFLLTAALTAGGLMFHSAFARDLSREASQAAPAILPGACSGSSICNPWDVAFGKRAALAEVEREMAATAPVAEPPRPAPPKATKAAASSGTGF